MTPEIEALHEAYHNLIAAMNELTDATEIEYDIMCRTFDPDFDRPTVAEVARYNLAHTFARENVARAHGRVDAALRDAQIAYLAKA